MNSIKKTRKLIIVGAGETANLAYEYFTYDSDYDIVGFAVEKEFLSEKVFLGFPVIPLDEICTFYSSEEYYVFVAISSAKFNRVRTSLYQRCKSYGYKIASYVSSKAFVWHNVEIGENCFILEDNTLQPFVKVGNNVTLWSGNHIGHRTILQDNCFITSHVVISGFCNVGMNCFIGVNTSVADNITIADDCLISLGSVVNENTEPNGIYKGNPAKKHPLPAKKFFCIND